MGGITQTAQNYTNINHYPPYLLNMINKRRINNSGDFMRGHPNYSTSNPISSRKDLPHYCVPCVACSTGAKG